MIQVKTGCIGISSSPFSIVTIVDGKDRIVYARKFTEPVKQASVNLQSGSYEIFLDCQKKNFLLDNSKPLYIPPLPKMPPRDNKKGAGGISSFQYFDNKKKGPKGPAFTDTWKGIMYYTDQFIKLPYYAQQFIIEHERAHLNWLSEEYADLGALCNIIRNGGNISPCLTTLEVVLKKNLSNNMRIFEFKNSLKQYT